MSASEQASEQRSTVGRLILFIASVNLLKGLGLVGGVIYQPLVYFFKEGLGWAPDQVTQFLSVLVLPWMLRPVYGLISDFVPICGYHRRPYIVLGNLLVLGGFLWITGISSPGLILVALYITAFGLAISCTVTEAVLVEQGKKLTIAGKLLSVDSLFFNIGAITASLAGGWLTQHFPPQSAFHAAAWVVAFLPVAVLFISWCLVEEKKVIANVTDTPRLQLPALGRVFFNKAMLVTAAYLFLWGVIPSFGIPLYYYMTDSLKFTQTKAETTRAKAENLKR